MTCDVTALKRTSLRYSLHYERTPAKQTHLTSEMFCCYCCLFVCLFWVGEGFFLSIFFYVMIFTCRVMLLSSKPFLHEINHNVHHAQLFIHLVVAIGSTQMKWSVAVVIWSIHVSFVMHQDQLKRQRSQKNQQIYVLYRLGGPYREKLCPRS